MEHGTPAVVAVAAAIAALQVVAEVAEALAAVVEAGATAAVVTVEAVVAGGRRVAPPVVIATSLHLITAVKLTSRRPWTLTPINMTIQTFRILT
jgi:hypothetical protein